MYDTLIYIMLAVSALGTLSQTWGRVCLVMFSFTALFFLMHNLILTPWPFSIKYLGYYGAATSVLYGGIFIKVTSLLVHADLNHRERKDVLFSIIGISILYFLMVLLDYFTQLAYNAGLPKENIFNQMHDPGMSLLLGLQIILIIKGGWDGTKRLDSIIMSYFSGTVPNTGYNKDATNLQKRKGKNK